MSRTRIIVIGLAIVALAASALAALMAPPSLLAPDRDPTVLVTHPLQGARSAPDVDGKNLVLVIACTLRKDQTSIYGGPDETTPFLAELASSGTRFSDLITVAPWTRAAATALLTGHHPISVGMVEEGDQRNERVLPDSAITLAERLRARGWATAGITANPNLNEVYGFHQGFDAYRQLEHLWRKRPIKVPGALLVPKVDQLLDQLPAGRPVFLQVVLIDGHSPFLTSPTNKARFEQAGVPDNVAAYRTVLNRLDDAIRELDGLLRRRGLTEENTIFAVVNDHGEGLSWPAHHGRSHGRYLAPSTVGGVFVARGPGVAEDHEVTGITSQVDVMPTLLSLLGVPTVNGPGHDLSAQVRGSHDPSPRQRAFTETWYTNTSRAAVYTPETACQLDFLKNDEPKGAGFEDGCFERIADPMHERPFKELSLLLELRRWRRDRVAEAKALPVTPRAQVDPGLNRQLEALGYVDPEAEP